MTTKKKSFNESAATRGSMRRVFARSPIVLEVMNEGKRRVPKYNKDGSRAKVDRVEIQCQVCNEWKPATIGFAIDHIEPVIGDEGFIDWNTFHARLWCPKSNLQRICKPCHKVKTNEERFQRTLKKEWSYLKTLERDLKTSSAMITVEDVKFLKKFTGKRLIKYPKEFFELVNRLKKRIL